MSSNLQTANAVGKRHAQNPVILKIDSKQLVKDGQAIKKVGKETFITETIDPKYITLEQT